MMNTKTMSRYKYIDRIPQDCLGQPQMFQKVHPWINLVTIY